MKHIWLYPLFLMIIYGTFAGCSGEPHQIQMKDPSTLPTQNKKITFPNGLMLGGDSRQQATALAEIMVESHNMAVIQRERIEQEVTTSQEAWQRLQRAYERNQATTRQAWNMIREIAAKQGTGEITIFFPVDSARITKDSPEYKRLVRFADFLARESHGRTVHFISVGSASSTGPHERNIQLARKRAHAPVPILGHYLVNVPHTYDEIYGTGDAYSLQRISMQEHQRYQHVHVTAFYEQDEPADGAQANDGTQASPEGSLEGQQSSQHHPGSGQQGSDPQGSASRPTGQTFTNSLDMTFKRLPPGTFTMGSPADEYARSENERQHQVTLTQGFYMQTTEVTQGQWEQLMGSNPSFFQNCGQDCPVEQVSWQDVQAFISKLNSREDTRTYRLPTEAEWEYACRAGSQTAFANEGEIARDTCGYNEDLAQLGWYYRNSEKGTHPVQQKQANAWGLYDMHGNVWEWCHDWQGKYSFQAVTDPTGPEQGLNRIRRGGSWSQYPMFCRAAYRSWQDPQNENADIGFRLVRDVKEPASAPQAAQTGEPQAQRTDQQPVLQEECIIIRDVTFEFDSAQILEEMRPVLIKAAQILKNRTGDIQVQGHTCSIGSDAYNLELSERRAQAVAQAMIRQGIDSSRISTQEFGERQPKYDNDTEAGRRLNRRVEIHIQDET